MHAYFIKCNEIIYNEDGSIKELHCTYDPQTKSGTGFNERKPNGTIQYVDAATAASAQFNIFEPLMLDAKVSTDNFKERMNPNSWTKLFGYVEGSLKDTKPLDHYQFVRCGYYVTDKDSTNDNLIFNQTVGLKSSFNK